MFSVQSQGYANERQVREAITAKQDTNILSVSRWFQLKILEFRGLDLECSVSTQRPLSKAHLQIPNILLVGAGAVETSLVDHGL